MMRAGVNQGYPIRSAGGGARVERPPGRLLEWLRSAGPQSSGKCPPGANDTGKPEKMGSVNAMSTEVLDNLIKQAERLSPDEQMRLAAYLVERARQASSSFG